jgi:hypothetical protein
MPGGFGGGVGKCFITEEVLPPVNAEYILAGAPKLPLSGQAGENRVKQLNNLLAPA